MKPQRNHHCPCGSGKKYKHCCENKHQACDELSVADINKLGLLFNAGQFNAVEILAYTLLDSYPDEARLWKFLAIALHTQGKECLTAFQKTAELLPSDAGVQMNLGNALKDAGRLDEALHSYQRALAINPAFSEAHINQAATFSALGQLENAVASYRRALHVNRNSATAHHGLGGVLRELEHLDEAAASYRRAIKSQPNFVEAYNNLGVTLRDLGQLDEAVTCYQQALKIQPDFADVHSNLGVVLRDLGQLNKAIASFQQALFFQPDDPETLSNLGLTLHDLGRPEEAIAIFNRVLSTHPNHVQAHINLGLSLREIGQYSDAVSSCQRAITLQSNLAEAHNNLGNALSDFGKFDEAVTSYRKALEIKPNFPEVHSSMIFSLNYTSQSSSEYLAEALRFGESVASKVTNRFTHWQCHSQPQRLRVGMVSADFHHHPVGFFLESFLAQIDRSRIELIAYTNNPISDALTTSIKPYFSQSREVFGLNDQAAAQLIHSDGVHVLIDLSGHTAKNRLSLFAWKPAPVQVSWLGYFASTGVAEIDYLLADEIGVPESQRTHFSETIWYLPETRLCFTPPNTDLPVTVLPSLSNGHIMFGCYQNLAKVSDEVLAVWGRILIALPNACLRLASKQLQDTTVVTQLRQRLQQHSIDETRVFMHGAVPRQDYLASHAEVDIALDTFPYPGGTTTCESLWMGVPTLTLAGTTLLSRQGASLLTVAGLPDWVATSEDEYVAKAIHFASNLPRLAALRAGLREQVRTSPLFDAPRFAKYFEAALWGMWQNFQEQQGKQA